ncbi:MAG: hypothetical protein OXE17_03640 [Chloroflexi bacterium]|nr:hypothetical protein [Chloroflexota bacterium]
MFLWILRALTSTLAGLCIYLAIGLLLFHVNLKALLNDELYADSLSEQNAYERLYTDVLTTRNIEQLWSELSSDTAYLTSGELHYLMRAVAPPEYLQAQVETNLALLSSFANGESQDLELYLEISGPLERIVESTVDLLIDRIEATPLVTEELIQGVVEETKESPYSEEIQRALESLSAGGLESRSITDLTGLSEEEVAEAFDQALALVLDNPSIDQEYRDALRTAEPELRQAFKTGDTRELLTQATMTAAAPALDNALADFQHRLDSEGRLSLIPVLAEEFAGVGESEFQANADTWRERILAVLDRTRNYGLLALAAAIGLVTLVYWGRPRAGVRWFYRMLIASGGASLVFLTIAYFALPRVVDRVVNSAWMGSEVDVEGFVVLILDVVVSVITARLVSFMWYFGIAFALGILMWALFLTWDMVQKRRQNEASETVDEPEPVEPPAEEAVS